MYLRPLLLRFITRFPNSQFEINFLCHLLAHMLFVFAFTNFYVRTIFHQETKKWYYLDVYNLLHSIFIFFGELLK